MEKIAEINALKLLLQGTDYKCMKFAEGEMTEEEFAPVREKRAAWRARINELEIAAQQVDEPVGDETGGVAVGS